MGKAMGLVSKKKILLALVAFLALVLPALCKVTYTEERESNLRCNGSMAECYMEEDFFMHFETSRRVLEEGKLISHGAQDEDLPTGGLQAQIGKPNVDSSSIFIDTERSIPCKGSIGECSGEEIILDSEINSRILVETITYPAIAAGDGPGLPFQSSQPGGSYNKPCYKINGCKSDIYQNPE